MSMISLGHVRLKTLAAALLTASLVVGCASLPPPPPPPPPPPSMHEGALVPGDWRGAVVAADRDRYQRRADAWRQALQQAESLPGSGDLGALGALIDPEAALPSPTPPVGNYRCRTVKLGAQGDGGLGYVVYGWFACRIERTDAGLKFVKLTGSQRPSGLLFPEDDRHMVFLGSMALSSEPAARSYGLNPERDMIALVERIGERRWRLVIPWPTHESNLDLIELLPTSN